MACRYFARSSLVVCPQASKAALAAATARSTSPGEPSGTVEDRLRRRVDDLDRARAFRGDPRRRCTASSSRGSRSRFPLVLGRRGTPPRRRARRPPEARSRHAAGRSARLRRDGRRATDASGWRPPPADLAFEAILNEGGRAMADDHHRRDPLNEPPGWGNRPPGGSPPGPPEGGPPPGTPPPPASGPPPPGAAAGHGAPTAAGLTGLRHTATALARRRAGYQPPGYGQPTGPKPDNFLIPRSSRRAVLSPRRDPGHRVRVTSRLEVGPGRPARCRAGGEERPDVDVRLGRRGSVRDRAVRRRADRRRLDDTTY